MAVSFVAAGTTGAGTGAVTPGMPAGATTGDLILLHIEGEGEDANADGSPTGGAWTLVGTVASATDGLTDRTRHTIYWAWYDAGLNRTVPDAGNHTLAVLTAWRGVDSTTPFDVASVSSSSATNNTSVSITGLTTVTDGAMIVASSSAGDDTTYTSWANASLASITEAVDITTTSGSDGSIHVAYGIKTSFGAVSATTATSSASEEEANWCMALRPGNDFLTSGTINGGGGLAATVVASHATTGTVNSGGGLTATPSPNRTTSATISGGGSIAPTVERPTLTTILNLGLEPGSAPYLDRATMFVRWRVSSASLTGGSNRLYAELLEGTTVIASTDMFSPTTSFATWSGVLSEGEVQSITDWSNLRFRFQFFSEDADVADVEIADAWLSIPAGVGTPTATGTINGGGSITATVEKVSEASDTINGGGSIAASFAKAVERTGTISGGGSISASVTATETASTSGVINGGGSLAATVEATHEPVLGEGNHIRSGGSIAPTSAATHVASDSINGGGSITPAVTATEAHSTSAAINGGGSIAPTLAGTHESSDAINGGGSIAASATSAESHTTSGTISGGGSVTATVTHAAEASTSISGGGSIAPTPEHVGAVASAISGGGRILASTGSTVITSGVLNTGGGLAPTVEHAGSVAGTINGGGSITPAVTASEAHTTSASISAGGGLSPVVTGTHESSGTVSGGGDISTSTTAARTTSATINGGGSITGSATSAEGHVASGIINAGGGLSPVVAGTHDGTGTVSTGGGLTPAASGGHQTSTQISGGGSIAASATKNATGVEVSGVINGGGRILATVDGVTTETTKLTFSLSDGADPGIDTGHIFHIRHISDVGEASPAQLHVELFNGAPSHSIVARFDIALDSILVASDLALLEAEAALILDYTDLFVKVWADDPDGTTIEAQVYDLWLEVPLPPPPSTTGELNTGGGLTAAQTHRGVVPAFPDLGEGLLGPLLSAGGNITAATSVGGGGGTAQGSINGGGNITAAVTAQHTTSGTINGGARIVVATGNNFLTSGTINGGGKIYATATQFLVLDASSPGLTAETSDITTANYSTEPGETAHSTPRGETTRLQSRGETSS